MAKIGIVPMSAKPYHAGHDGLVRLAAKENDEVHLYVSTSNRDVVSGDAMAKIWRDQIEPSLPNNVVVTYGGSPVGNVWKDVGEADIAGSEDTFRIYSDPEDAATNFPDDLMQKYASGIFQAGRLTRRPVERTSTVNVSGTKMRAFLTAGDKKSFLKFLPKGIDGNVVWDTLTTMKPSPKPKTLKKSVKGESVIREFVRLLRSRES